MKHFKHLFTALLLLCATVANAYDIEFNGVYYNITDYDKFTVEVTSGDNKYTGSVGIPEKFVFYGTTYRVTSIGNDAFAWCDGLTSVTIGNSVTSIENWAFWGCSGLTSITIPNSVTSIGNGAFVSCSKLTSITIPNSVTSIGSSAFSSCAGLTSVTIGNSVTSIGDMAFAGCSELESIVVDTGNTKYDSRDNCNAIIETESNTLITGCKNTIIPNSVISIGEGAFVGCAGLTSITIPNSVTSIGSSAFSSCAGLTSVTIGNSVTSIENWAFGWCSGLTSITIPNSVTSIGNAVFYNCENLADVYCLAIDVPATNNNAFGGSYPENMTLHVLAEAISSYKTTEPWSNFGNIIVYVTPKCAAPVIEYRNGELFIECDTKNAEFVTTITNDYTGIYNSNAIALTATYNISVYATAAGYENSDIVNATLCWIECDCDADDNTDIINIPAKAVFVTSNNGTINISCSLEGENVAVYSSNAMFIGSTTIENGCASIQSGLSKGDIAIIKIAEKSIKVILN